MSNKDELRVPLELATIPTPRAFADAIESLSPEQQAFARAFRAMQLSATLFGVLVVQVKPQLEAVLNLPPDALALTGGGTIGLDELNEYAPRIIKGEVAGRVVVDVGRRS